jgi:hypothetical protein
MAREAYAPAMVAAASKGAIKAILAIQAAIKAAALVRGA